MAPDGLSAVAAESGFFHARMTASGLMLRMSISLPHILSIGESLAGVIRYGYCKIVNVSRG